MIDMRVRSAFLWFVLVWMLVMIGNSSVAYGKKISIDIIAPFHEKTRKGEILDDFWSEFQRGVVTAQNETGVKVNYQSPEKNDINQVAGLISQSINGKANGVIISVKNLPPLQPVIRQLQNSKKPFFTVATPEDNAYEINAMLNIGEETYQTGQVVGTKLKNRGGKYGACIITAGTDVNQLLLCNGFIRGFGGSSKVTRIKTSKANAITAIQEASLRDTRIDSIFILHAGIAPKLIQEFAEAETLNRYHIVAFDVSIAMQKALSQEGAASIYALSDQPYLQGYLSVIHMTNYLKKGLLPARNVLTSPLFIDREKIDKFPDLFE